VLLLTTDGKVSAAVRTKSVEKEYYIRVSGNVSKEVLQQLRSGIEIKIYGEPYITRPCKVEVLQDEPSFPPPRRIVGESHGPFHWLSITLTEGKYRQIRKMTAAVGLITHRLVRVRIGIIMLNNMKEGEVIELESIQMNQLEH